MIRAHIAASLALLCGCSAVVEVSIRPGTKACSTSPAPPVLDFAIATIAGAAAVGTGHVDAWLIVPGVFAASGVLGTITTYTCRHQGTRGPGERPKGPPPPPPVAGTPPPSTDAPKDPDARDATPGEMGVETEPMRPLPRATEPPPIDPGACSIEPTVACPEGQSCLLEDGNRGHCVVDR